MRTGIIKSSCLNINSRMDAEFWLEVIAELKSGGIDPDAATSEQVRAAIIVLNNRAEIDRQDARRLRDEAAKLREKARELEASSARILGGAARAGRAVS